MNDKLANPAPLGLLGFGMTTVLLNLHNAGLFPMGSMVLAMGICYGGIAQVIAGIMEYKKGNTFGTVAFCSYGLFWLSLVVLLLMPKWGYWDGASKGEMMAYFFMWGLFTFLMFIGTLRINAALQFVFLSLAILFWLLVIVEATGSKVLSTVTGIEGIICGLSAIYAGIAQVWNEVHGKEVLPLGVVKPKSSS
jgi:succinate-acetate transporter protein